MVLGKSQADAYRSAYNTLRMNDNSIRREASRLMDNPNVATTVAQLQHEADAAVVQERTASREEVLQTLTSYMALRLTQRQREAPCSRADGQALRAVY